MVLKPQLLFAVLRQFENDVKMYGTQTLAEIAGVLGWFENDVKMYGTQTKENRTARACGFENDVKMYGTQTSGEGDRSRDGLRMM